MQDKITIADAPDCLNTNDKAMWVLGYQAALAARSTCLHQIQVPSATEQAAWHAGLDEGRAQAGFTVSNAETPQAAPAAVAVPDESPAFEKWWGSTLSLWGLGPKSLALEAWKASAALAATPAADAQEATAEQQALRDVYEQARGMLRYDGIDTQRAIQYRDGLIEAIETVKTIDGGNWEPATAAAPVVLPEPDFWVRPGATIHPDRGWQCWSNDGTATGAFHAETVRSLMAGVSAPAAHGRASVTPNGDKWKLVDGDMREAGEGLLTYHADAYREGLADGALLATATGLPAQAVAYIDSEVLTSFLSSSNYRPEDGWDCHIRHQENKRDTDVPLYAAPQAQADARDAAPAAEVPPSERVPAVTVGQAGLDWLIADIHKLPTILASEIDGEESDGTPRHWRNRPFVSRTQTERLLREFLTPPPSEAT